jgi:hypothetical protein
VSRRPFLGGAAYAAVGLSIARWARAESPTAPLSVQAQLLTRVFPFDRNASARVADGVVVIQLVHVIGNSDSVSAMLHMEKELADIGQVGQWGLATRRVPFSNPADVAAGAAGHANVLCIAPALGAYVPAVAEALVGSGVLTFAAVEDYVPMGAVLGVRLEGGRPQMSINLAQAHAQRIDFPSSVLKILRVY